MVYGIITCIYILNKNSSYLSTLNFDVYGKCIDYIAYMNPMGIAWPWFNKLINLTSLSRAQPRMELLEPGITEIRWSPSPKKRAQGGPIPLIHGGTWGPYTWGNWCSFTPIPGVLEGPPGDLKNQVDSFESTWNPGSHPFRTSREFFEFTYGILYIQATA